MNKFQRVLKALLYKKPVLEREAFDAYLHRLPESVNVAWERDGKYIVGYIEAGNESFATQGESVDEFIDMVNDAIYTVYDIPEGYKDVGSNFRAYNPPFADQERLQNLGVKKSTIFLKREQKARLA